MEITIVKEFTFDAAHFLPGYDGPCANLHGHTYKLQVGVKGEIHPISGMVLDFSVLKEVVGEFVDLLDHTNLNTISVIRFPKEMPTAEKIVEWFVFKLIKRLRIVFIRLYETPTSYAEWRA